MLRRWLPLLAVAALLSAAFAAAVYAEPQFGLAPPSPPSESAEPAAPASGSAPSEGIAEPSREPRRVVLAIPSWLNTLLTAACVLVVVVVAGLLLWYVLRDTIQARGRPITVDEGPAKPAAARAELAAALTAGLAELADTGTDPRQAVIACWVRLEQAAADAGTPRQPADSSTDLVLRLLSTHQVSRPVLGSFAAVYRQARYSTGPVDESMRATAVAALEQLRAELSVRAATP